MAKLSPKELKNRYQKLKAEKATIETHWQEIADFVVPRKNDITKKTTMGEKREQFITDSTARQDVVLLAAALSGLMTNPAVQWFELTTGDERLNQDDNVRLWLQDTTRRIHSVINRTNFQQTIHELYIDLVTFGTGAMSIEENPESVMHFTSHNIASVCIEENYMNVVDEVYREFTWPARKIVEKFGIDNVGEKISKALEKDPDKEFCIIHGVYKEDITKISKLPYLSQWVSKDDEHEIKVGRFRELPFVVPRWSKASDEKYGYSPAMVSLPDIKMINLMEETVIKGAQKTVDPPLQVPDDGVVLPIVTRPGGINFVRSGSGEKITPIFNDARIDFGIQVTDRVRDRINKSFFVDQLQLRESDRMTATEVVQRKEESMRLIGPQLGRLQTELLKPMISRIMGIMERKKMFTPPPAELDHLDELDVQYSSSIAKAQRVSEAQNLLRAVEASAPFVQANPQSLDVLDSEMAVRLIAETFGIDQRILRTEKEVGLIRQQRADAQRQMKEEMQQQQNTENVAKLAPVIKQQQA